MASVYQLNSDMIVTHSQVSDSTNIVSVLICMSLT